MSVPNLIIRRASPQAAPGCTLLLPGLEGLDATERAVVDRLLMHSTQFPAGHELIAAGSPLDAPLVLQKGWAGRLAALSDGRRQILDLYAPGELIGYSSRAHTRAPASYVALTPVEVSSAAVLLQCGERPHRCPRLVAALHSWEEALEARLIAQILRLGRQSAVERTASLLVELHGRFLAAGRCHDNRFPFALTQEILADILGLSTVHVNRTLQHLRHAGFIRTAAAFMEIRACNELRALADFGSTV